MNCPRCDRGLSQYALSGSSHSAVVCEACGFVGVSTSHRIDQVEPESWDAVVERVEGSLTTLDFGQHSRTEGQELPTHSDEADTTLDSERLETTIPVGVAIEDDESSDDDAADAGASDQEESS